MYNDTNVYIMIPMYVYLDSNCVIKLSHLNGTILIILFLKIVFLSQKLNKHFSARDT